MQRGFSLLEMLVVLMVIVIITSTVTLTVNSGGQDIVLESRVRAIADAAEFALDEAQMAGENYGLHITESFQDGNLAARLDWYRRDLDGWQPLTQQDVFAPATLPPDIELELVLSDAPLSGTSLEAEEEEEAEREGRILPQLVFYASGEMTEGALNIRRRENSELLWRLEWDLLGRIDVLRRGEPALEEL
jgi:general secretion pathway protein H